MTSKYELKSKMSNQLWCLHAQWIDTRFAWPWSQKIWIELWLTKPGEQQRTFNGAFPLFAIPTGNTIGSIPSGTWYSDSFDNLRFRVLEKGSPLPYITKPSNQFVIPTEHEFLCRGDWQGVSTVGVCRSALSKLHSAYESFRGDFAPIFPRCVQIPFEQVCKGQGCSIHCGRPQFHPRGILRKVFLYPCLIELHSGFNMICLRNNVIFENLAFR
jgi:hypothetical protein